jgi:glycosyltransferase involved in cell wall biosynthesis
VNVTTMPKTVSGVITAYDRPAFLREAIESALMQTRPLLELIVVDDSSPRDLSIVVAPFGERVRYLRLPQNQGANAARNAGIAAACRRLSRRR